MANCKRLVDLQPNRKLRKPGATMCSGCTPNVQPLARSTVPRSGRPTAAGRHMHTSSLREHRICIVHFTRNRRGGGHTLPTHTPTIRIAAENTHTHTNTANNCRMCVCVCVW